MDHVMSLPGIEANWDKEDIEEMMLAKLAKRH